jgi:hypothetical protein
VCGCTRANKEIASANTEPLVGARREKIPRWQMNDADQTDRPAKHEKLFFCVWLFYYVRTVTQKAVFYFKFRVIFLQTLHDGARVLL